MHADRRDLDELEPYRHAVAGGAVRNERQIEASTVPRDDHTRVELADQIIEVLQEERFGAVDYHLDLGTGHRHSHDR